jgi:two-component system NtrC family sensor kinase
MVTPIYNEPACSNGGCHVHHPSKRVLGVVDIVTSLEPIDRDIASLQRTTVGIAMATMLGLVAVVNVFTRRYVVLPVGRLIERTHRIARGDLSAGSGRPDATELGILETSVNDMAGALARMRAERLELLGSLERQVEDRTAQLKRAQERLVQSEKLSSLGRLAASIAHEINNPLAGILTYAKLMIRTLREGRPDDRTLALVLKHLALVQKETERCTAIVRNLLDFARERPLTLTSISVNGVLDDALTLVMNQARLQNISLERRFGDVPPVRADAGQLRQAFVNVIINACDAMPGGGTLTVDTRLASSGDAVDVRLADTGVGIPKAVLSKVLDPFFTTKEKGTGLGLSVVYGIVERHGGRLAIESEEGRGTEVRFTLMVAPDHESPAATASPLEAAGSRP